LTEKLLNDESPRGTEKVKELLFSRLAPLLVLKVLPYSSFGATEPEQQDAVIPTAASDHSGENGNSEADVESKRRRVESAPLGTTEGGEPKQRKTSSLLLGGDDHEMQIESNGSSSGPVPGGGKGLIIPLSAKALGKRPLIQVLDEDDENEEESEEELLVRNEVKSAPILPAEENPEAAAPSQESSVRMRGILRALALLLYQR
jgi:hypothetical protein